jgi:DNA topoisomerase IB
VSLGPRSELGFDYTAKGGIRRVHCVHDPEAFDVIAELKRRRRRDRSLLAYEEDGWHGVRSNDLNDDIHAAAGEEFTAKDFRTWHGTVLAAVALALAPDAGSTSARKRAISGAIAEVADRLGNTPAVCRASYVDPRLLDRYLAGATIPCSLGSLEEVDRASAQRRGRLEHAVLDLLDGSR